jgi:hypothetical protein
VPEVKIGGINVSSIIDTKAARQVGHRHGVS